MTWRKQLAPLLPIMSLTWCVLIGGWIWFTPIWSESNGGGDAAVRHHFFSEVSYFGPAPLVVPVLIAAIATWAAWRGRRVVLGLTAFLLAVFTFISGFSIGRGYIPASGLLLLAAVLTSFLGSGERNSGATPTH